MARGALVSMFVLAVFFGAGLFRLTEIAVDALLRLVDRQDQAVSFWAAFVIAAAVVGTGLFMQLRSYRQMTKRMAMMSALQSEGDVVPFYRPGEGPVEPSATIVDRAHSSLERVIGIGQTRVADDISIELIALELRRATGRLTVVVHDPVGQAQQERFAWAADGSQPDIRNMPFPLQPVLRIEDNLGTTYELDQAGGGGDSASYRLLFVFVPRPPREARTLSVVVDRLTDHPSGMNIRRTTERTVEGPWRFDIDLTERE
jgi:hypothetical protein